MAIKTNLLQSVESFYNPGKGAKFIHAVKVILSIIFGVQFRDNRIKFKGASHLGLLPGDIVAFIYADGTIRVGLVASSLRAPKGQFLSTRNNLLLNIFLLHNVSEPMIDIILKTLYLDRVRCTYKDTPKILGIFFPKNSFRTFNTAKIKNLQEILIS